MAPKMDHDRPKSIPFSPLESSTPFSPPARQQSSQPPSSEPASSGLRRHQTCRPCEFGFYPRARCYLVYIYIYTCSLLFILPCRPNYILYVYIYIYIYIYKDDVEVPTKSFSKHLVHLRGPGHKGIPVREAKSYVCAFLCLSVDIVHLICN